MMVRYVVHFEDLAYINLEDLCDYIADGPSRASQGANDFIDAIIDYCVDQI